MQPIVLFRKPFAECEYEICRQYFDTIEYRSELSYIHKSTGNNYELIIPRYSALPYYQELERDVNNLGGMLINSYEQHKWIANFEWYETLKNFTPKTWTDDTFFSAPNDLKYVVKGRTNSKKHQWNSLMFAENKRRALEIASNLMADGLIGEQGIIYREYIPLETYEIGINGLPFTNEWRFFFYKEELLTYGYYWSITTNPLKIIEQRGIDFAERMAHIISNYTNFFVIDIGKSIDNRWYIIELNCGTMSGLSECDPHKLYRNLKARIN